MGLTNTLITSIFLTSIGISLMASSAKAVEHRVLTSEKEAAIASFWQEVNEATFFTEDKVTIAYVANFKRSNAPYIVIIPGRSESYLKYQELAYDLDVAGYDSVIIDHRGQGLSQRLVANHYKGYVGKFDDYAKDINQLLNDELPNLYPNKQHTQFMLAHSMGGAIALRYLQNYPNNVKSLVLSSPMIAISSGGIPNGLAKAIVKSGAKINQWLSDTPWYFFGQSDSNISSFEDNKLMHSKVRYQRFQHLYQQRPELKLGGVTFNWLDQALKANTDIFNDLSKITQPVLLMQASDEHIVDNSAQDDFCQQLHQVNSKSCIKGKTEQINGAYHELLFEIDKHRNKALDAALTWFAKQN